MTNVGPGYPQEYGRDDLYEYLAGLEPPKSMREKRFLICKENKNRKTISDVGEGWSYSNVAFQALGDAMEICQVCFTQKNAKLIKN